MTYSKERRAEVLAECDVGKGTREVALLFRVSESWVCRVKQEHRERGKVAPATTRRRRRDWDPHADWLREKIAATLQRRCPEIATYLADQQNAIPSTTPC